MFSKWRSINHLIRTKFLKILLISKIINTKVSNEGKRKKINNHTVKSKDECFYQKSKQNHTVQRLTNKLYDWGSLNNSITFGKQNVDSVIISTSEIIVDKWLYYLNLKNSNPASNKFFYYYCEWQNLFLWQIKLSNNLCSMQISKYCVFAVQ